MPNFAVHTYLNLHMVKTSSTVTVFDFNIFCCVLPMLCRRLLAALLCEHIVNVRITILSYKDIFCVYLQERIAWYMKTNVRQRQCCKYIEARLMGHCSEGIARLGLYQFV